MFLSFYYIIISKLGCPLPLPLNNKNNKNNWDHSIYDQSDLGYRKNKKALFFASSRTRVTRN